MSPQQGPHCASPPPIARNRAALCVAASYRQERGDTLGGPLGHIVGARLALSALA